MRRVTFFVCLLAFLMIVGCRVQKQPDNMISRGSVSIKPKYQHLIDSIVNDAITQRATPGCHVLAVVDRNIVFDRCYGYLDYDSLQPVTDSTLYDLASVTKMAASSLAMMAMYDDGVLELDRPLNQYLKGITDNGATLRDALAHQAGFKVGVPLRGKQLRDLYKAFVADSLPYDTAAARQTIVQTIAQQEMDTVGNYLYSDFMFYIFPEFIRKYYHTDIDKFLNNRFYHRLGIRPSYNPLNSFPISRIAPTELDTVWRRRVVRGTVHDEGAAMMGGVSGHAGLFSTAYDMAVIMQMLLNRGEYGEAHFINPATVDLFTAQAFDGNRRGLVFDKPLLDTSLNGTPSKLASRRSFGHMGFTGTFVWADPDNGLIFVFLCNRTYPDRGNMLSRLNVRTQLHDIFYQKDLLR